MLFRSFEGIEDIGRKMIRCVGDPGKRFDEDALARIHTLGNLKFDAAETRASDNSEFKKKIRQNTFYTGKIETKAKNKEDSSEYEIYYNYSENLKKIPSHRILAINRAQKDNNKHGYKYYTQCR